MANLLRSLFGKKEERHVVTIEDYISAVNEFVYNGMSYGYGAGLTQQTLAGQATEQIPTNFGAFAQLMTTHDVIFSVMAVRALVFSGIRIQWQKQNADGRPSKLFGSKDLAILENPWPGGTTQDLLVRMIQDVDLCGNSYWTRSEDHDELVRLRPDWIQIVCLPRFLDGTNKAVGYTKLGYVYYHGGIHSGDEGTFLSVDEVAHFAPIPDPTATYRGMSWISPLISEIQNDKLMQRHKKRFLENGATSNMVITLDKAVSFENFQKFKAVLEKEHVGPENAYKMMFLGAGADAKVVGTDMKQLDFKQLQGHSETRIAAAGGVPPIIVGLSEGLASATYSNYGQARRRLADATMHPLWQNVVGSLSVLMKPPGRPDGLTRLWYDAREHPFLREDEKDLAEINQQEARTIGRLIDSGFEADSVIEAVTAQDWTLLKHTGLFSVQLQPPGTVMTPQSGSAPTKEEAPQKTPGEDKE